MAKRSPELRELQEAFALHVLFGGDPDGPPLPCWFAQNLPDPGKCEGRSRAAHWIKRQRVRNALDAVMPLGHLVRLTISAAEWDPRNGVPSCALHDERHDGQAMPPLVVPESLVPEAVWEFTADWGLETALEDRLGLSHALSVSWR